MVSVDNNYITVTTDDNAYLTLKHLLTRSSTGRRDVFRKDKSGKTHKHTIETNCTETAFDTGDHDELLIPTGLGALIRDYISITDDTRVPTIPFITDIDDISHELSGITLREEQVIAVKKCLRLRRLIISIGTGGGKTEIACSFILALRRLSKMNSLSMIMLEPSSHLVSSTIDRFRSYGINACSWSEHRGSPLGDNEVVVTTPVSLRNDMKKNPDIRSSIKIIIADECHHASSESWYNILSDLPNLEYAIGLSATAVSDKSNYSDLSQYSIQELKIIGVLGPLKMKVTAGALINKGSLATPVLIRMSNKADESIPAAESNNWHRIVTDVLRSESRNRLVTKTGSFFAMNNRQVLILVSTIEWARDLLRCFDRFHIKGVCASYGGHVYEECTDGNIFRTDNGIEKFKNKEVSILIASSHLYEGADLPNLDAIILAFGGRKERLQLQGIGRALRKSKTGKYAYIIDFTDHCNGILNYQSRIRLDRYIKDVGITPDRLYDNVQLEDLIGIFNKMESE